MCCKINFLKFIKKSILNPPVPLIKDPPNDNTTTLYLLPINLLFIKYTIENPTNNRHYYRSPKSWPKPIHTKTFYNGGGQPKQKSINYQCKQSKCQNIYWQCQNNQNWTNQ